MENQELEELKKFVLAEMHKVYWDSMNQSMNECLDSGEVDRETLEPMPEPMTEESLEAWGERNFPAPREAEKGEIIFSLWDGFTHHAQQASNKCYVQTLRDFDELQHELNPPPPRQADVEITSDNIPEELIDMFAEDAWETDSGGINWEKTFESLVDDGESIGEQNHFKIWTSKVTYIIKEENDYKGPLDYGSKTLRKLQRLVRETRC